MTYTLQANTVEELRHAIVHELERMAQAEFHSSARTKRDVEINTARSRALQQAADSFKQAVFTLVREYGRGRYNKLNGVVLRGYWEP